MNTPRLNQVYSDLSSRRRYEVWFLKMAMADGSGAWWFRYLLTNPGGLSGGGCADQETAPVQIRATWFPKEGSPVSFVEGFPLEGLTLSKPGEPLLFEHGLNRITHDSCHGLVTANGRTIEWDLRYRSNAGFAVSNVGWIGFSRTPHTDAVFDGELTVDGATLFATPLGYGLQGHNCGFRHRHYWSWAHGFHQHESGGTTTFEALEYEIGAGLFFRRALLWHFGNLYRLSGFRTVTRQRGGMDWVFGCSDRRSGVSVAATFSGGGPSLFRLPYTKTDCSGVFEVGNNSLATGQVRITIPDNPEMEISFNRGTVLELVGEE